MRGQFRKAEAGWAAGGQDPLQGRDLHKLVKRIMKEVRSGRTVEEIAARNCVDVDGILNRMELRTRSRHHS